MTNNSLFILQELQWLEKIMLTRLKLYFRQECEEADIFAILPPPTNDVDGAYPQFIRSHTLGFEERLALILAFVPTLRPQILDCLNIKNSDTARRFVEFGCVEIEVAQTLMPTFETALFLLAADSIEKRVHHTNLLSTSILFRNKILSLKSHNTVLPLHFSILSPSLSAIEQLINETNYYPDFSTSFPATRLTTASTWKDLILNPNVKKQIDEIKTWIEFGNRILNEWNLKKSVKPGYRVLFHGASGTGKTMTAALLGKYTNKDVYRIDLSMIVSKYIGETEKNLSNIFDKAENKSWILFFDEADALFGKRTNINDSHDRYANQEISFLLQRIENYNGLVVLSTNLKRNIDEAFTRRFQSIIHFPSPKFDERLQIWLNTFSPHTRLADDINMQDIASRYDLTGGSIVNIVQYASLMAMQRGGNTIELKDLMDGIGKEYQKAGKTL
ncbi:hypothetical protein HW49_10440 [Porphyromonadaceae bacterium COT-184 OH4590]|nr:hypothetical protein HW49_10440 [Porphyromonadaceae bacterium COT-184 OH4590]